MVLPIVRHPRSGSARGGGVSNDPPHYISPHYNKLRTTVYEMKYINGECHPMTAHTVSGRSTPAAFLAARTRGTAAMKIAPSNAGSTNA